MMRVQQVPRQKRWPSGDSKPLAVLAFEPSALAERYGLSFEEELDDLDQLRLAAIALPDGSQAWLYKHRSDPNPGTLVRVDSDADPATVSSLLRQTLELDDSDFLWVAPVLDVPSVRR
jgi:hypothetical protein